MDPQDNARAAQAFRDAREAERQAWRIGVALHLFWFRIWNVIWTGGK